MLRKGSSATQTFATTFCPAVGGKPLGKPACSATTRGRPGLVQVGPAHPVAGTRPHAHRRLELWKVELSAGAGLGEEDECPTKRGATDTRLVVE